MGRHNHVVLDGSSQTDSLPTGFGSLCFLHGLQGAGYQLSHGSISVESFRNELISEQGLNFTRNIPVLNDIGSTFSNSVLDILGFLTVIALLMMGFAMSFQIMFCTSLVSSLLLHIRAAVVD